jgi:hypothetical protein
VAHMLPNMTKIDEGEKKKDEMIDFTWEHGRGVGIAKIQDRRSGSWRIKSA